MLIMNVRTSVIGNRCLFIVIFIITVYCSFPVKSELKATQGKVIQREIYTSGFGSKTRYHIILKYIYEVNGKQYESGQIWYFRIFYQTREAAEKSIEPYKLENPVTVYFRPADPKEAYLEVDDD